MGQEMIYWLVALLAVGVIVAMIIGLRNAGKSSGDKGPAGTGTAAPGAWTPPVYTPPVSGSGTMPPVSGPVVTPPVRPVQPVARVAPVGRVDAAPAGPQPVTIFQFPYETVTCICPRCDGENEHTYRFCWICGQKMH